MWRAIKRQLKFKGSTCCGSSWPIMGGEEEEGEEEAQAHVDIHEQTGESYTFRSGENQGPRVRHMSLAMALQFDRHFFKAGPRRSHIPLIRLLEDMDGPDHAANKGYYNNDRGIDGMCCVCMERNRDAAFISCGHTYCRPCSKDIWSNRGSCPLCNRRIDDILNIY